MILLFKSTVLQSWTSETYFQKIFFFWISKKIFFFNRSELGSLSEPLGMRDDLYKTNKQTVKLWKK